MMLSLICIMNALTDTDSATLTSEAYRLLALSSSNTISDAEHDRLILVACELDRRGVTYEGAW